MNIRKWHVAIATWLLGLAIGGGVVYAQTNAGQPLFTRDTSTLEGRIEYLEQRLFAADAEQCHPTVMFVEQTERERRYYACMAGRGW